MSDKEEFFWEGRLLSELSRAELEEAIGECFHLAKRAHEGHLKSLEVMKLKAPKRSGFWSLT